MFNSNTEDYLMEILFNRKRTRTNVHADVAQTCGQEVAENEKINLMIAYENRLTQSHDQDTTMSNYNTMRKAN